MSIFGRTRSQLPEPGTEAAGMAEVLPGTPVAGQPSDQHAVLHTPMHGPWPAGTEVIYFAMGCFWGAERIFWRLDGVVSTAVGYMGGATPNPSYEQVCSGRTGQTEAVLVAYDPARISPELLLKAFWENHDPTQGYRQGNDVGTQYRSAIYPTTPEQDRAVAATREAFQKVLSDNGFGQITADIRTAQDAGPFYYAEDYHQQYLDKNPFGYCNHGPNGMTCPVGLLRQDQVPSQQDVLPADHA